MKKANELAVVPEGGYLVTHDTTVGSTLVALLTDSGIRPWDLERIQVPSGGAIPKNGPPTWSLQTLEGSDSVETFDGIVAAVRSGVRKWWRVPMDDPDRQGSGPPDCQSMDGIVGHGVRSVEGNEPASDQECVTCPWSQFGSNRSGPGADCREGAMLLLFQEKSRVPDLLSLAVTSLDSLRKYAVKLAKAGLQAHQVVTRFGLEKAVSRGGISYAKVTFRYVRTLDEGELPPMEAVNQDLTAYLGR